MAGEWIKVTSNLHTKPEVFKLARLLSENVDTTVGMLVHFWCWADSVTVDGVVDGVEAGDVDAVVKKDGFCEALISVGWLIKTEVPIGIELINFSRHNGESAKKRTLKNERQARWRAGIVDESSSTNASTREEKRREEKSIKDLTPLVPLARDGGQKLAKAQVKTEALQYLDFLNAKAGKHFRPVPSTLKFIEARLAEGVSLQDLKTLTARKCRDWLGTEQEKFLRPETLCNATKCHSYLGEIPPEASCNAPAVTEPSRTETPASADGAPLEHEALPALH